MGISQIQLKSEQCAVNNPRPSSRQTEGPTGPLYASSNPEYLSASDGKSKEGFWALFKVGFLWLPFEAQTSMPCGGAAAAKSFEGLLLNPSVSLGSVRS